MRVVEDTDLGQDAAELGELGADSSASRPRAWVIRADSRAMSSRSTAGSTEMTSFSSLARRSACSSSGRSSKSSGMRRSIRCRRYASGSARISSRFVFHALQRPPHGVDAGGHAALEHRHDEADGPARRRVVGRGADRLVLDVAGQGVVEVELLVVQLERGRLDLALREQLLDLAGVRVGEGDQGLLGPPQVERGVAAPHGVFQALDVAVDILVEQRQEPAEVFGVPLVRRGRHQQVVVGHAGERFAEPVGERLAVVGVGAHLVGLVDDDEVPMRAEQALLGVLDRGRPRRST